MNPTNKEPLPSPINFSSSIALCSVPLTFLYTASLRAPTMEYSIKLEKYQAMKRYNYNNSGCKNFLSSLIQCSLLLVLLGLFLSSPLWLPTLCSSTKLFFIESLPKVSGIVLGPKCLFLVFNLIIVFLVGESRLSSSSPKPDICEEYVVHTKSLKRVSSGEGKGNGCALVSPPLVEDRRENEKEEERVLNVKEEEEEEERVNKENEEEKEEEFGEDEEEREERGLPAEELNKRVEDFIARVYKQRRLEARMLVCCG